MAKIVSANRLSDGIVVYRGDDGSWHEDLNAAHRFSDKAEAEAGLAAAREDVGQNLVVDPFLVEVEASPEGLRPLSLRNAIRAAGPTIDYAPKPTRETAGTDRSRHVSL